MKRTLFTLVTSFLLFSSCPAQVYYWGTTQPVGYDGVMEIGKTIDFHMTNPSSVSYDTRIYRDYDRLTITSNTQVNGRLFVPFSGAYSDNVYNGNIVLCKPSDNAGQFINIIRNGCYPWSIGMVYGSNTFAIGTAQSADANFVNPVFTITDSQLVGIGTTSPDSKLTVNGTVHAKEVRVDLNGALADYVFEPDYELAPLSDVQTFIQENRHLPDMPSAAQAEQNGVSLGEMQNLLLRKIEELTLYTLQQEKRIKELEDKLDSLNK